MLSRMRGEDVQYRQGRPRTSITNMNIRGNHMGMKINQRFPLDFQFEAQIFGGSS